MQAHEFHPALAELHNLQQGEDMTKLDLIEAQRKLYWVCRRLEEEGARDGAARFLRMDGYRSVLMEAFELIEQTSGKGWDYFDEEACNG